MSLTQTPTIRQYNTLGSKRKLIKGLLSCPNKALLLSQMQYDFDEIESFLGDTTIDIDIRSFLAKHVNPLSFSEVKFFLKDHRLDANIKGGIISRVQVGNFGDIEEFLRKDRLHFSTKIPLIKSLREVNFLEAEDFLKDYSMRHEMRCALASRLAEVELREVEEFLKNDEIVGIVRSCVALRLKEMDFSEAEHFLKLKNIFGSTQASVARRVKEISFSELAGILKHDDIYWQTQGALISRLSHVSLSEIENFLQNNILFPEIEYALQRQLSRTTFSQEQMQEVMKNEEKKEIQYSQEINHFQCREIGISLDSLVPKQPSLVLYCRPGQGYCAHHFHHIALFLNDYIKQGYSQVWNNFKIVTRQGGVSEVGGISVEPYMSGKSFIAQTSLFADMIHLSHGTPEATPGTHSILGTAITSDPGKQHILQKNDYTPVNLLYYDGDSYEVARKNTGDTGYGFPLDMNMQDICKELLRAIKQAEKSILAKISTPECIMSNTQKKKEKILSHISFPLY
ncbi:hypothetical protein MK079_03170 [Candidatus Gracilibacteria bacterium]|nr:hypothetical protein [Candidatus Gracilibacteria bacterium]